MSSSIAAGFYSRKTAQISFRFLSLKEEKLASEWLTIVVSREARRVFGYNTVSFRFLLKPLVEIEYLWSKDVLQQRSSALC